MNRRSLCATIGLMVLLLTVPQAPGQQAGEKPAARPPEVEKLVQLAKDPDRLRQALSDPQKVQEIMDLVESDAVREYVSDPQRVMALMTEIDPGQMRQVIQSIDPSIVRRAAMGRWMERLRKQLGSTDEEWKVLAPRIENLLGAQQEARAGTRGVRPGAGGGGRFGNFMTARPAEPSDLELAAEAVRMAARDPDVPDRDTILALREYRKARDKARERLAAAERDVRELLTQRQEAILLMIGLVE